MLTKIDVETAMNKEDKLFIDVRSPEEFVQGTIEGAINIPLLNNEERAEVGTIYKQQSPQNAKKIGLQHVSTKLPCIYNKILDLSKHHKEIIIFCSRGGLRSSSLVNFLNMLDINVFQLEGGYKSYRNFVLKYFNNIQEYHDFIVLHGYTGVGKTDIITLLKEKNIPSLDLEAMACNSGSVFGTFNYSYKTMTQKNFEASLIHQLINTKSRFIVVESESQRIGTVHVPKPFYEAMVNGKHILINTSMENRICRLVNDYVNNIPDHDTLLTDAISNLKRWIGKEKVNECINLVGEKRYDEVAVELIKNYYDPLYKHSIQKYHYDLEINYDKIEEAIERITEYYHHLEGMTSK